MDASITLNYETPNHDIVIPLKMGIQVVYTPFDTGSRIKCGMTEMRVS